MVTQLPLAVLRSPPLSVVQFPATAFCSPPPIKMPIERGAAVFMGEPPITLGALPVGAVFWWGFALPIPPILAIVYTILIVMNWQNLT